MSSGYLSTAFVDQVSRLQVGRLQIPAHKYTSGHRSGALTSTVRVLGLFRGSWTNLGLTSAAMTTRGRAAERYGIIRSSWYTAWRSCSLWDVAAWRQAPRRSSATGLIWHGGTPVTWSV